MLVVGAVHSSVAFLDGVGLSPPAAIELEVVPIPVKKFRPVFKLFCSDQLVPFHNSVLLLDGLPPKYNAAVLLSPEPLASTLPVFKSATSVQLVPSQDSVLAFAEGLPPPKYKADV